MLYSICGPNWGNSNTQNLNQQSIFTEEQLQFIKTHKINQQPDDYINRLMFSKKKCYAKTKTYKVPCRNG